MFWRYLDPQCLATMHIYISKQFSAPLEKMSIFTSYWPSESRSRALQNMIYQLPFLWIMYDANIKTYIFYWNNSIYLRSEFSWFSMFFSLLCIIVFFNVPEQFWLIMAAPGPLQIDPWPSTIVLCSHRGNTAILKKNDDQQLIQNCSQKEVQQPQNSHSKKCGRSLTPLDLGPNFL